MDQYSEKLYDPKGQGQPPAYTTSDPPQGINNMGSHMHGPMGPHMHGPMGHQMHGGMGQHMHIHHPHHTGMMQPVGMMQPTGMYPSPVVVPMVVGNQMGRQPAPANCPSCREVIVTRVEAKATMRTHMFALMMLMMCCLPCALIPYCTDTCRNADHYCPNCNSYIGSYVN